MSDPSVLLSSLPPNIAAALCEIPGKIDALGRRVRAGEIEPEDAADELGSSFVGVFAAIKEA